VSRAGVPAPGPAGPQVLQALPVDARSGSFGAGRRRSGTAQAKSAQGAAAQGAAGSQSGLKPVHVGCSGWNYRDWREQFYPQGLAPRHWLEHYSLQFETVEVNSTFYRLASREAVERWVQQTPDGFVFAPKASRYLTHIRRLRDLDRGVKRFYAPLEPLSAAGKLGPTLWQLPETFQRDDNLLATALQCLPAGRHCFEFRHPSWFVEPVYDLLRGSGAALVVGDHPERPFQSYEMTAGWTFVRFHYGSRGRGGNYSTAELETWKRRIAAWRSKVEVFAFFNNDWNGFAPRNARWLADRLAPAQGRPR
jgi:uncharacterized protein YecE (DUF72 family)